MTQTNLPAQQTRATRITDSIDKVAMGAMVVSSAMGGVAFTNMEEVMNFAKLMAVSDVAVPKYLRNNPGGCLAITIQALEWKMSPYSVANKSYVVNDRIAYESQLIHAVVESRGPLKERIRHRYTGEGGKRRCIVSGILKGETEPREFQSAEFDQIQPKNSPLWKTKPDLQLFYNASRDWARVYCPDVILGVYSTDELPAAIIEGIAAEPGLTRAEQLKRDLKKRLPNPQVDQPERPSQPIRPPEQVVDADTGEVTEPETSTPDEGSQVDETAETAGGLLYDGDESQPEATDDGSHEAAEAPVPPPQETPKPKAARKAPKPAEAPAAAAQEPPKASTPPPAKASTPAQDDAKLSQSLAGDWESVKEACYSAAPDDAKPDIAVFEKGVALFTMMLGKKGKEATISPPSRLKLFKSIQAGTFDYATGKAV